MLPHNTPTKAARRGSSTLDLLLSASPPSSPQTDDENVTSKQHVDTSDLLREIYLLRDVILGVSLLLCVCVCVVLLELMCPLHVCVYVCVTHIEMEQRTASIHVQNGVLRDQLAAREVGKRASQTLLQGSSSFRMVSSK